MYYNVQSVYVFMEGKIVDFQIIDFICMIIYFYDQFYFSNVVNEVFFRYINVYFVLYGV